MGKTRILLLHILNESRHVAKGVCWHRMVGKYYGEREEKRYIHTQKKIVCHRAARYGTTSG